MMKKNIFLFIMSLCPLWLGAQTAQWVMKPQYSSIVPYGENLLKAKLYNKVGLLDREGRVVVPVNADSITSIVEDVGLVLRLEEGKYRLLGLVNRTSTKMLPVMQEVYVEEYPFFSEGKLPVCNKKGLYGFMDVTGRMVLDFNYGSVHPFSEGWAAVSKGSVFKSLGKMIKANIGPKHAKMYYVNERGQFMTMQSDIGDVYSATTFKNGEALVVTKDNRYCFINTSGNIIRMETEVTMKFDRKYALCLVDEEETEEETVFSENYDGPVIFAGERGLYGYKQKNKMVLPAQFSKAFSFSGGYAIAAWNDFWGILKLEDGNFDVKISHGTSATGAEETTTNYALSVPESWKGGRLLLYDMTDGGKKAYPGKANGSSLYEFSVTLPKGKRKVCIGSENLLVWSNETLQDGDAERTASSASESYALSVQFSSNSVKANAKDIATVNVIIRNNGQEAVDVTVKVTGDRLWTVERTLSLKAGGQEAVPVSFYKIASKERRTVNVQVSGMANIISKKIGVNPFYEDF